MFKRPIVPTHKCAHGGCKNQIPTDRKFCLLCQYKLIRAGLCAKCGDNPRKPKRGDKPQSNYCEVCAPTVAEIAERKRAFKPHPRSVRPDGADENTQQTKRGLSD